PKRAPRRGPNNLVCCSTSLALGRAACIARLLYSSSPTFFSTRGQVRKRLKGSTDAALQNDRNALAASFDRKLRGSKIQRRRKHSELTKDGSKLLLEGMSSSMPVKLSGPLVTEARRSA